MIFSDFEPGTVFKTESRYVSEQEIVDFAARYDPQWFHTDPLRAARGRWHGLISSGWMTCAIAMELVVRSVLEDSECFGSPGVEQLRWRSPLRAGDEVWCKIEVLEVRRSPSGNSGSVRWRWELINKNAEVVLELITTNLFDLRPNALTQGQAGPS